MKRALAALALLALGCREPEGSLPGVRREQRPVVAAPTPPPPPLADAQGRLLGSGVRVDWLELPRGFTARPKAAGVGSAYEASGIAPERVRDFLLAQMLTGSAEELGQGVVYRGAMPVDGRADAVRMDVEVLVTPRGGILLRITPVTFPHVPTLPEADAKKLLAKEQRNAE
jgi:hypothetical protein